MPQVFADNNITFIGFSAKGITRTNVCGNFSSSVAYNKGELVWKDDILYKSKNGSHGEWNSNEWTACTISDAITNDTDFVKLGNKIADIYTVYTSSSNFEFDENGNIIASEDKNLYRYNISSYEGKYIFCSSDFILSKTVSANGRVTTRKNNEFVKIENGVNYIIISAAAAVQPEIYSLNESAKESDILSLAQHVNLPVYTTSVNTRLAEDGSVTTVEGYTLYRYNVENISGKVYSDSECEFSTTPSASNRLTVRKNAGYYIIPNEAKYLLVSSTVVPHVYRVVFDETTKKTDFDALSIDVLNLHNDVNNIQKDIIIVGNPIPAYNISQNSWIKEDGTAEYKADYNIVRFDVSNYIGKTLKIMTNSRYCFSTTASASNHITNGLTANTYVVPNSAVYLLVSSSNDYAVNVAEIKTNTQYGKFGLQFSWKMNFTQRVNDAAGKTFTLTDGVATSDFDNCYPWSEMKLCNISNPNGLRTIVYEGDANFSYNNNTFVEIPKFYFKREYDKVNEWETWSISDKPGDGFVIEPWFLDENGNEIPVRYVARYNLGASSISKTNTSPLVSTIKANLKNQCTNNGYSLMDIYAYQAISHLFVIETGTKDSQSIFPGVSYYLYYDGTANKMVNNSATTNDIVINYTEERNEYFGIGDRVIIFPSSATGYSDGILRNLTAFRIEDNKCYFTFDGEPIELTQGVSRIFGVSQPNGKTDNIGKTARLTNGDAKTRPFSYRGIENIYGNLGEVVDKLIFDRTNHRFKIDNAYVSFTTPDNESYIEQTTVPKWIRYFGIDPKFPTITLPGGNLTASYSDSYSDEWSTFGTGETVVYSVAWDHCNANGIFCYRCITDSWNQLYTGRAML